MCGPAVDVHLGQLGGIQIESGGDDRDELRLGGSNRDGRGHPSRLLPPMPLCPIQIRIPPGRGVLFWQAGDGHVTAEVADQSHLKGQDFPWMVRQGQGKASRSYFAGHVACSISAQRHEGAHVAEGGQPLLLL